MRLFSVDDIQNRIVKVACALDCENIQNAKQGKTSIDLNESVVELMFFHEFMPYWTKHQVKEAECYLNEKYKI